jgi:NAD(P)-dependent dehydrogenase (short-subunit alcohol dehydrogenase family)
VVTQSKKVAVVTGASQGIGAALVDAYRKLDYAVVAVSRSIGGSTDTDVLNVAADVSERGVGARVIDAALDEFGRVDTLVNNAGIFIPKPFTAYSDDDFDAIVGVNLRGFFELTRSSVAAMLDNDGAGHIGGHIGHIVNVSTSLVDRADASIPAALASLTKGGLVAATRALAIEYAAQGIRVNAVSLGAIKTPMNPPELHEMLAATHPLGRMGETGDVVDAIVYLENAPFVTGEILRVDGGQSAGH